MTATYPSMTPSRFRRFACMMYEGVLLFGVVFLAAYLFDTLTQSKHALMYRHGRQAWLFLALGVYFILCWRRRGQTLPMKTWNIKLVDRNGQPPSIGRLILRYILVWPMILAAAGLVWLASRATGFSSTDMLIVIAPFAAFAWTWIDRDGQFLHDRLLGTRLVDVQPSAKGAASTGAVTPSASAPQPPGTPARMPPSGRPRHRHVTPRS